MINTKSCNFDFSRGKDCKGAKGGHWTERSEGSGWSDSETLKSLFFAKQKATQKNKKRNEIKENQKNHGETGKS